MPRLDPPEDRERERYEAPISPAEREDLRRAGATDEQIDALEKDRLSRVRGGNAGRL